MKFTVAACAVAAGSACIMAWLLPRLHIPNYLRAHPVSAQVRRASQGASSPRHVAIRSHSLTFEPQSARLSDNTHIELQAVTWGNQHRFQSAEYNVPPVLPEASLPTDVDALCLWITGARDPHGPNAHRDIQPGVIRIYDEAGREATTCEAMTTIKYLPHNSHLICLRAFPRRASKIVVEVVYDSRDTVRFHIPNPRIVSPPLLPTESLPGVKQDGELEVTLEGLHPIPAPMAWSGSIERLEAQARMQYLDTLAAFHYRYAGQPDANWTPAESVLWDSTGNCYSGHERTLYPNNMDDGTGRGVFKGVQFYQDNHGEPLTLSVWFRRAAEANFAPEEQVTIADVPYPARTLTDYTAAKARWNGTTLQVYSIQEVECVGKRTCLEVHAQGLPPHAQLLLQARDERGRMAQGVVGPHPHSKWIPGYGLQANNFPNLRVETDALYKRLEFLMDLPPGASKLTLTFAVNQAHYLEFTPPSTIKATVQRAALR